MSASAKRIDQIRTAEHNVARIQDDVQKAKDKFAKLKNPTNVQKADHARVLANFDAKLAQERKIIHKRSKPQKGLLEEILSWFGF